MVPLLEWARIFVEHVEPEIYEVFTTDATLMYFVEFGRIFLKSSEWRRIIYVRPREKCGSRTGGCLGILTVNGFVPGPTIDLC